MKTMSQTRVYVTAAACVGLLAGLGLLSLRAADVNVRAIVDPPQISLGRAAQLTIEITGANSARINPPTVENLDILAIGQQTSLQIINGAMLQQSYYFFKLVPYAEGQYIIPSFQIEAGGQKVSTAPLTLKVLQGQAPAPAVPPAQSAPTSSSNPAPDPQAQAPAPRANPTPATPKPVNVGNETVFLRLYSPRSEMVVGQVLPVTVKLYVRADRQAELVPSPLKFLSDAFTVTLPKKLEQDQEVIDNTLYNVGVWNIAIVPVKTGDYSVGAEQAIRIAERVKMRRPGGLDESLLDAMFSQYRMVEKKVQSTMQNWKVTSVPNEGKPENFSGAIGDYTLTVKAQPDKVKVGEPISLEMIIDGKGNLDRVNAPVLTSTDGFKTYSPTSKIELRDDLGLEGRKIFTEAVVPLKVGTLPPIAFTFYNPDTKQYVTRTVEAPRIVISEAPAAPVATTAPAAPADTVKKADDEAKPAEPALVPIKVYLSPFVTNFQPVFRNPLFLAAQGLPLIALVAGFVVARRRQRLESDPDYARTHEANRTVRTQLEAMNTAVTRNDAAAFFTAARRAVQFRLADRWRVKADDITFEVISERSPELADSLKSLFLVADEMAYSGEARTDVTLADWQKAIVSLLGRLEKKV